MRAAVVILLAFMLSGCASIINGRSQSVAFESTPPGADLTVGGLKATTPAKLTLTRHETYAVTFSKADYPERTTELKSHPSWWLLGNAIFGGLIGLIIDFATGSGWVLSPPDLHMDLQTGVASRVKHDAVVSASPTITVGAQAPTGTTNFSTGK